MADSTPLSEKRTKKQREFIAWWNLACALEFLDNPDERSFRESVKWNINHIQDHVTEVIQSAEKKLHEIESE